jgi:hypothetical protein
LFNTMAEPHLNLAVFEAVPTARAYRHLCGAVTQVSDGILAAICNPYGPGGGTECSGCEKLQGFNTFVWADTGEPIDAYRRRLKAALPPSTRRDRLMGRIALVAMPFIGLAVGLPFIGPKDITLLAPIGGMGLGLVVGTVVGLCLLRRSRIDFRRYR